MNWTNLKTLLTNLDIEVYVWSIGLILLALSDPDHHHLSICPIANLGYDWCPGCGLGRSVALIFNGRIIESFWMHPLGLLALSILTYRIISLFKRTWILTRKNYEQDA